MYKNKKVAFWLGFFNYIFDKLMKKCRMIHTNLKQAQEKRFFENCSKL